MTPSGHQLNPNWTLTHTDPATILVNSATKRKSLREAWHTHGENDYVKHCEGSRSLLMRANTMYSNAYAKKNSCLRNAAIEFNFDKCGVVGKIGRNQPLGS